MTEYLSREKNRVRVQEGHNKKYIIIEEESARPDFCYRFPPLNMRVFDTPAEAQEALDLYAADHDLEVCP
ncbi:hypothetical protein [Methanocorpusculum vombati]|uniref:Uncharacterized protein n=1 Tax=Methanocorpusculum vombati TaxID=3002864 RepID=A0ABT4IM09_9EURY|nr:hypothetical protein [Methanocorpusculum vombati]MCZ9319583.1 hypothetical protein [Methanocorpusculum sp.]MCZ0862272.1 hypothetical protein [Methanocorpusculum vombati]MDE2519816.1 hypothetical protein [Methanocorpusculum sp.]MDE2534468.1 hypothetical protein [Methanocorpusculum sp.]MDE2545639.1 hypothetical protein [Methanocorpusculum sp.]